MRIMLTGHRSFAAQGLREQLMAAGHEVVTFNRGPAGRDGNAVSGSVEELASNPHFDATYDTVINYILLKDDNVERNVAYVATLLDFCQRKSVKHLIHISSISSFKASERVIHEGAKLETVPEKKGSYGSLKSATDLYLIAKTPAAMKLTMARPAFILGPGVISPIVGTAARLPWNRMLVVGNGKSRMPLIGRDQVNAAIVKAVANPPEGAQENLMLVAPNSPTRVEYLQACCEELGCGNGVSSFPKFMWWGLAVFGQAVATLIGKADMQVYAKLTARLPAQRYDSSKTEQRLGMKLDFDWRRALRAAMDGQEPNFVPPYQVGPLPKTRAKLISYLGFGRIVKQKHLPALKDLGFAGKIDAFDIVAGKDATGQEIRSIRTERPGDSDLIVVASPGTAHIQAIAQIGTAGGPVLVEKPLCYSREELAKWQEFAAGRKAPVYVCHNYRFKQNVRQMVEVLAKFNPGGLRHVHVHFESPPVSNSSSAWMRNERVSRTLLLDFSLHFMDLATMFGRTPWKVDSVRHELNVQGQTALIDGILRSDGQAVSFLLRQGFGPRRARILYNFQNYSVSLGFFPDTFAVYMSNDNPWQYKAEKKASMKATLQKIKDKLTNRESDDSHPIALAAALGEASDYAACIRVEALAPFYDAMFDLSKQVYGI